MKNKQLLLIGLTAFLFSCSSPMDKKFNEETAKEDIEAIKGKIDSTELQLLAGSMIRLKFQDKKLEGMTYSEILEDGKKWKSEQEKIEAEQKALAERAAREGRNPQTGAKIQIAAKKVAKFKAGADLNGQL